MTPFEQEKAEAERRLRRIAEQNTYMPPTATDNGLAEAPARKTRSGQLFGFAEDDLLLTALFILLYKEDSENNAVMLILLAVLLFS